jgi:hypothetical protein
MSSLRSIFLVFLSSFHRSIVLACSHLDRPGPGPSDPKTTLIYTMVEIGHRIANQKTASWVAVTSDPQHEHESWTKSGGRDSVPGQRLKAIRVPPFSIEEAQNLLARLILDRATATADPNPTPSTEGSIQSTPEIIKKDYSQTISFLCGAAGTRARWLLQMLQFCPEPLSNTKLEKEGDTVDPSFYPYLPEDLHTPSLKVDPAVWKPFSALITERNHSLKPLVEVPGDFVLPPSPQAKAGADGYASRVLAVNDGLHEMLNIINGEEGAPTGVTFEALRDEHFRGHEQALRDLCAKHILFYNYDNCTLEFESGLMRRVVNNWLHTERHKDSMQLLRKLTEWQKAKVQQGEAEAQAVDWQKLLASFGYGKLAAARSRVEKLEGEIEILRGKLHTTNES